MNKSRIEAFSDGVIAIIITIMVLEISAPAAADIAALKSLFPGLLSYIVSFGLVGTYWNNHHHLFQLLKNVNSKILWSNLLFLFMLSLFPVCTDWISKTHFAQLPISIYSILMLLTTISYVLLRHIVISSTKCGKTEKLANKNKKEIVTIVLELMGLVISFITPIRWLCIVIMAAITPIWIIPDLRISKLFSSKNECEKGKQVN